MASFTVKLTNYIKRDNSTGRPPNASGYDTFTGYSRDPLSIMNPVIGFKMSASAPTYNYAFCADLNNRYYWIDDWTFTDGLWYASMHTDVLATYRTQIGSSYEYILRSSYAYDGYIPDMLYPLKHAPTSSTQIITDAQGNTPWPINGTPTAGGYYIVGIINGDAATVGGVSYYCFSNTAFRSFMSTLLNTVNWTQMDFTSGEISEELYKSLFNPMQYLVSCIWTPITPPMSNQISAISFGWWTLTGLVCYQLTNTSSFVSCSVPVSHHIQTASRGQYLDAEPFTRITAVNGPFGVTVLDPALYIGADFIECYYRFDFISGKAMCRYAAARDAAIDDPKIDKVVWCDFAVPIQLSQVNINALGAAQSLVSVASSAGRGLVSTIAGAVTGNAVGALAGAASGLSGAASGIISAADCMLPQVQSTGFNGGFSAFDMAPYVQTMHWDPVASDNADRGKPLCRRGQINGYPGFLLIADPQFSCNGTAQEIERVRQYMAAGFFYE